MYVVVPFAHAVLDAVGIGARGGAKARSHVRHRAGAGHPAGIVAPEGAR
jgi:hypothetical protein